MSVPRTVSREQIRDDPYIVWNEYIGLLARSDYRDLTDVQQAAHLVFWYEHEVQNGGHLQYFENRGSVTVGEVISALQRLGARCQAEVLSRAAARHAAEPRPEIESVSEYVAAALEGEFDDLDREFHGCQPSLTEALGNFLAQNQREFVLIAE